MLKNKVFETVLKKDLPPGTKIIDSVWAMKKKSNGTLCGQLKARRFKQVKGQHYNGTKISSLVTNSATIRIFAGVDGDGEHDGTHCRCQGSILTWRI